MHPWFSVLTLGTAALLVFSDAGTAENDRLLSGPEDREYGRNLVAEEVAKVSARMESKIQRLEHETRKLAKKVKYLETNSQLLEERSTHFEEKAKELENENAMLRATNLELSRKVDFLEIITRQSVPRNCHEIKLEGIKESGPYLIDPDGPEIGDPPFTAECDLSGTIGITKINHNTMNVTDVNHCADPGCHVSIIAYEATAKQMRALLDLSESCYQPIKYLCFSAPFIHNEEQNNWWSGSDGTKNYYWDGAHPPATHVCACDADGTCVDEAFACNCDSGAPQWLEDAGTLTAVDSLPVVELRFGGLKFDGQVAQFELGPLLCSGKKRAAPPDSCEAMLLAGHTLPGYYILDLTAAGGSYEVVFCNFQLDPSDIEFQVETQVKFPEFPVAFDFSRDTDFTHPGSVVPYTSSNVNIGNAMTMQGTFTAPLTGVYAFTFFFDESGGYWRSQVNLRVNGTTVASIIGSGASNATAGDAIIVRLSKGQTVDAFLALGAIGYDTDTHFTGKLLFPLQAP